MNRTNSVAALLALALLGTNLSMSPPIQDRGRVDTGFVLEAGDHNVLDLIDRAAEFLGRNILSDPAMMMAASPGGTVIAIQKQIAVDALGCEDLLSQLLYTKGFALVPLDTSTGMYEVIAMQGPRRAEIMTRAISMTPEEVLRRPNLKMVVVTSVPLENVQIQVATNSLRPFFAAQGQSRTGLTLGNVGNNRVMLLMGFADQVAAAIRLVRSADVPPGSANETLDRRVNELEKRITALEEKVGR